MPEAEETISKKLQDLVAEKNQENELSVEEAEIELGTEIEPEAEAEIVAQAEAEVEKEELLSEKIPVLQKKVEPASVIPVAPAVPAMTPMPSLEVELRFLLDRKHIPLTEVRSLAEGKIISLGSPDFCVDVTLQEKTIAEAKLVLVDGHPSLQITKVFQNA